MRTVRITQTLRDRLRDSNRKVTFLMDGTAVTSDFFDWVDHTLHGVSKDSFWQSGVARDIGTTNNRPYISTSDLLKPRGENENPIGGYFVVSKTKSSSLDNPVTVISQLGLSRFVIPTRSDIEIMKITLSDVTPSGRERTYVAAMQTQSGSAFGTVYIPHGGYYEAESHKYTTHANLWTRTLVSGNQGFSTTSPEFGYWYQFLYVYKSKVNFSNMRIAKGSGGIAPDAYSAFKYMPIRPVWK